MARPAKAIEVRTKLSDNDHIVLPHDALDFLSALVGSLTPVQDTGVQKAEFSPATAAIRNGQWKAAPLPRDLADLRTALTAPLNRKQLFSALNSGARLCIADACDLTPPSWQNLMQGQQNLMDRWSSAMEHVDETTGKRQSLSQHASTLMLRVRPLDQAEPHVKARGKPLPAGVFDAGLYLFHTARTALAKSSGPYLVLTGITTHSAARRWRDVLITAESLLGLPLGAVRVAIEVDHPNIIWQLDEILHELREHASAVFTGGYRYANNTARAALARRNGKLGDPLFLQNAIEGHVLRVAHRRGVSALSFCLHEEARQVAERAVRAGFDGLIVATAEQAAKANKVFNDSMPTANQHYVSGEELPALSGDSTKGPELARLEICFWDHIRAALLTIEAWLSGACPPETIAQCAFRCLTVWHWIRLHAKFDTGRRAGEDLYEDCVFEVLRELRMELGHEHYRAGHFRDATVVLRQLLLAKTQPPRLEDLTAKKIS